MNPTSMRSNISSAAEQHQDETVIKRLTHETDLFQETQGTNETVSQVTAKKM